MKNKRILIYGAGNAGEIIKREISRFSSDKVIGFVDDDISKTKRIIETVNVLGNSNDIPKLIKKENINSLYIALPSSFTEKINKTAMSVLCEFPEIEIKILPNITKYFDYNLYQDLENISFSEIISRPEISLNIEEMMTFYKNKTVLITGAGGSIGSEIARQILRFNVKKVICLGRGENSLYNLKELIGIRYENIEIEYILSNVKDEFHIEKIINNKAPDIIIHAAAHKHVPIVEENPQEGFYNNIYGTYNVLNSAVKSNVKKVIYISTDKAVKPLNIMGATKRVSEILCSSFRLKYNLDVSTVRFGNVLGSRGSVIPKFIRQIKNGGPITVTHPDVERYFMSIPEASLLVLNAGAFDDSRHYYLLKMGKAYKIREIAEKLIEIYHCENKINIEYSGLRPGEKLNEELYYNFEEKSKTMNPDIFSLVNEKEVDIINDIHMIKDDIYNKNRDQIIQILDNLIKKAE